MKIALIVALLITKSLVLGEKSCHLALLKECGQKMITFEVSAREEALGLEEQECGIVQKALDCNTNFKCPKGTTWNKMERALRYSAYQFGVVFKKILCPNLKYARLKKMLKVFAAKLELPNVENIPVERCAEKKLKECYATFTNNLAKTNRDFHMTVCESIKCYEGALTACDSQILRNYVKLLGMLLKKNVQC